ncbi:MAG: cellulose biosynthesis protein BcsQ [Hydrogenophaga sp.]|uniref:cellulose biosynthesis protein BcsQ n=1 Tax=Hydrogenophaga sp. TaxID=1904254 RepID=UPI002AB8C55C|nr:cellulose biosynthesis protein BcsQ [Hydrogenophaga sp.]MDZ4190045.1 cellulose biosynthesis protein BcsQ [Hydrogenophaga sp.]
MSIVGIVSMKGGVGKTSTTANLAAALASNLGPNHISVVDLDPQNALHWHFGINDKKLGVCKNAVMGANIGDVSVESQYGILCLPYGRFNETDREAFEHLLSHDAGWLGEQLEEAGIGDGGIVLVDVPPGPSVYLKQIFACADLILIVLLADAGSYATVPAMESWLKDMSVLRPKLDSYYVLNQVDKSQILNRDVTELLQHHLGSRISPISIHLDEAVREALAFRQPVVVYSPQGKASADMTQLAAWLIEKLNQ